MHDGDERKLRNTFKNLVKMISQSPLLESIEFFGGIKSLPKSLHQLFESCLRLKHLSLAGCFVRLDDVTVMRHLSHLISLSLHDLSNDSEILED